MRWVVPSSSEILEGIAELSNSFIWLAIFWHLLVFTVLARKGWRPRQRMAAQLLLLPLLSVSILAWLQGNPFNGLMFLILILILGLISFQLAHRPVSLTRKWTFPVGICSVLYALVYPHFLATDSHWLYLIAAPMGVIPCPTLSLVLGFSLLFSGFHSRAWQSVLAAAGLFYALFGVLVLRVWLDLGLLVGAVAMIILASERHEVAFSNGHQANL
jgi:hypothetical protein